MTRPYFYIVCAAGCDDCAPHLFETTVNKLTGFRIWWEKRCSAFNSNESQTQNFRYLFLTSKNRTLFSRMPLAERTTTMYRNARWFLHLWHYHKRCTSVLELFENPPAQRKEQKFYHFLSFSLTADAGKGPKILKCWPFICSLFGRAFDSQNAKEKHTQNRRITKKERKKERQKFQ